MSDVDLGWIRVFVEVARAGSLSAAARALNLTQPAVSYQIRRAEEQLGAPLLRRLHRGTELTEAGQELFDTLSRCVSQVDRLATRLRGRAGAATLRVRTDYAFASLWLIPRIERFRAAHPALDIQIVAEQRTDPEEVRRGDTAVVFGPRADFGPEARLLIRERVVPVCTPRVAVATSDALAEARLIHLDSAGPARWFGWGDYLSAFGAARDLSTHRGNLRFNTYSLVIEATLAGQGIALGWGGLVDSLLRRGALVTLGRELAARDNGYFLLQPAPIDPASEQLRDWLVRETRGGDARPAEE
ncbi:MAG: LysR family transcriptional regulator [Rhodovulum sulfidophilum]|uniref:LysR family transcriptional regulator n=1 Tax=Rhodovulum sulfidophilum TaxID=35806 RepID=A0A2W5NCL6_RHOSU|nr:MAG: LysR family transcriptional regulator [Rhodovulum sulfidophilum]